MPSSVSPRRTACAGLLAAPLLVAACGARGPLDIVVVQELPELDASADALSSTDGQPGAVDAASDSAPGPTPEAGGRPGFDAGGLLACGGCLAQNCGMQLQACITSQSCVMTLQCVFTMCLSGGAPDVSCILSNCGGPQALGGLVGIFTCVSSQCPGCLGALGGLGGGGGGLPGGGGTGGAGG
jgi:hypothetical protein